MWYESLGFAAMYGVLGIALSIIGYKVFDLVETKIDIAEEIKKNNLACAVLAGSFIIGICFIIGRAIGS